MGRSAFLATSIFVLVFAAGTSRSDVAPDSAAADSSATLDSTSQTTPAGSAQKNPFEPYDVGGTQAIWTYESLSPEERAVVDRTSGADGWSSTHDGFAAAAFERSKKARAQAAEHQLGVDNLELSGVVQ